MSKELVLRWFLRSPEREFHIRQIAKIIGVTPMSARKYLLELKTEGFITEAPTKFRAKNYQANTDDPLFQEELRHHHIQNIIRSGLLGTLNKELSLPTVIFFGSAAKGEDTSASDVDIFVLSETKKQISLELYEKALGRRIQLFLLNSKEFDALKKKNKHLVNNIINGICLSGYLEVIA